MLTYSCKPCGFSRQVNEKYGGKKVACPKCKHPNRVPPADSSSEDAARSAALPSQGDTAPSALDDIDSVAKTPRSPVAFLSTDLAKMCIVGTAIALLMSIIWGATLLWVMSNQNSKDVVVAKTDDSAKREVLAILHKMESYTETGISFSEYSTRLLDVAAELKAANSEVADYGFKSGAEKVMEDYHTARDFWKKSISNDGDVYRTEQVQMFWGFASDTVDALERLVESQ